MSRLLLVEDHEGLRLTLADELQDAGYDVDAAADGAAALRLLAARPYDAVISDLNLPGKWSGQDLLERIRRECPQCVFLIITAYGSVESAVAAMRHGADDYLTKPFETDELLVTLERGLKLRRLEHENVELRRRLGETFRFRNFIGVSAQIRKIKETLDVVAPTDETILIEGETGTGKEIMAHAVHQHSLRCDGPFVAVSCASLPSELMESELFGHERGAFTGAHRRKPGRFEQARRGTLFLDEVDDIPVSLQVKLLRVLQERCFERVGGTETVEADVRVIASTKENLQRLIAEQRFREDLYYRLNVIPVHIPPLRERREDIVPLVEHFLASACESCDRVEIAPEALGHLVDYDWPGNVRQLENLLRRLVVTGQCRRIKAVDIPAELRGDASRAPAVELGEMDFYAAMNRHEKALLEEALRRSSGNKSRAADLLHMKPSTFRDRLAKHGLL